MIARIRDNNATLLADLMDGTNFLIQEQGLNPGVSYFRDSEFGGLTMYAEVDMTVTVAVLGATNAIRSANLNTLAKILDKATRWARGRGNGYAGATGGGAFSILFEYQPDGSSITYRCVLLGRAQGGDNPYGLSSFYAAASRVIPDNTLALRRRGLWWNASTVSSAGVAAYGSQIAILTYAAAPPSGYAALTIAASVTSAGAQTCPAVLLVASGNLSSGTLGNTIAAINGPSFAAGGTYSTVSDAANNPRHGTNVLRFTPAAANTEYATTATLPVTSPRYLHFFALVRNNSATTNFTMRIEVGGGVPQTTDRTPIDVQASPTKPLPVYLGSVPSSGLGTGVTLYCSADAASGTLDIDCVAILGENDEHARAISFSGISFSASAITNAITVDPEVLDELAPSATLVYTGVNAALDHEGDACLTQASDTETYVMLLCPHNAAWRHPNQFTFTGTYRAGYLVPE